VRRRSVRQFSAEPESSLAEEDRDAVRPVVRDDEIGDAVAVEIADVLQLLAEATRQ
jgi:hypothetical protein